MLCPGWSSVDRRWGDGFRDPSFKMARKGRLRLRPVRLHEGNVPGRKHIALDGSHSAFSRDRRLPQVGEVKLRDQPRMGD